MGVRDPEREPARVPARAVAVGSAVAATLVLAALAATSRWGPLMTVLPREPVVVEPLPLPTVTSEPMPSFNPEDIPTGEPIVFPGWLAELLQAVAIAAVVGVVAWIIVSVLRSLRSPNLDKAAAAAGNAVEIPDIDEEEVQLSFADALSRLRSGIAVDDAVVECWRRLERIAADSGLVRHPSQTSEEYTVEILAHTAVDQGSLGELASLYRQALFSTHVLTDSDRERAIACIGRLAEQLGQVVPDET